MGHPKKLRRKYSRPQHLFKGTRIEDENNLAGKYGLKNKKEIWKTKGMVARMRGLARQMLATPNPKKEKEFLDHLKRLNLIDKEGKLEDVLKLSIEDILERRLQTIAYRKGVGLSIKQARQLITHGHVSVSSQKTTVPGRLINESEEGGISFNENSVMSNPDHPARKIEKPVPKETTIGDEVSEGVKETALEKEGEEAVTRADSKTVDEAVKEVESEGGAQEEPEGEESEESEAVAEKTSEDTAPDVEEKSEGEEALKPNVKNAESK